MVEKGRTLVSPFLELVFITFLTVLLGRKRKQNAEIVLSFLLNIKLKVSKTFSNFASDGQYFLHYGGNCSFIAYSDLTVAFTK